MSTSRKRKDEARTSDQRDEKTRRMEHHKDHEMVLRKTWSARSTAMRQQG